MRSLGEGPDQVFAGAPWPEPGRYTAAETPWGLRPALGGDRIPAAGRARVARACVLSGLSWGDLQVFTVLPR